MKIDKNFDNNNKKNTFLTYLFTLLKGIVIGVANIIPGISGGTLALVLGIYQKFIGAFNDIFKWLISLFKCLFTFKKENWQKFKSVSKSIDWLWIFILFIGMILAIVTTSGLITFLLNNYPSLTYGMFFGLILASVVVPFSKMEKKGIPELVAFIIAFVLLFWFSGLKFEPDYKEIKSTYERIGSEITIKWKGTNKTSEYHVFRAEKDKPDKYLNIKITNQTQYKDDEIQHNKEYLYTIKSVSVNPAFWFVIIAGIVSASAMILPGLSGSYLLLMMGLYAYIIGSFSTLFSNFIASVIPLFLFLIGIIIGLLSFVKMLKFLLHKLHSITMAFLIGLMLGSLRLIYPFLDLKNMIPGSEADKIPKLYFWNMPENVSLTEYLSSAEFINIIICFAIGMGIVLILHFVKLTKKRQN